MPINGPADDVMREEGPTVNVSTASYGVAGMAHRTWTFHAITAAHAAAAAAQRKRRANAAPTIASVDRSFI
ncbi:hypothetical protein MANY_53530 [Mycolicibacterium anyangense]|uniref:Uncharacterized protein n=1 Tax=Mycolicibacterium anyangense TaxID=1431246 RepID=A0A6N4WDB4_9MYCO|nr:hypothetical protein MANY_53530 [Mycolicibacterium anyangense]